MSHKANFWLASLDPNRVKSGAFRVLFHLCDHHNGEADPRIACYPSQETLRSRTGLSNGALNTALSDMEAEGLILRRRSTVPGSSERRTYYILGCDMGEFAKQTPENGVSPNSGAPEIADEQTPDLPLANSSFGPSKLRCTGEEPVRTGKNQEDPPIGPPAKAKRPTRLPPDWTPSLRNIDDARDQGMTDEDIRNESDKFRDHFLSTGKPYADWDATWRNWCRRSSQFRPAARHPGRSSGHDALLTGFQRAAHRN